MMRQFAASLLTRCATAWIGALVASPALREAMLGDLGEVAGASGLRGVCREIAWSTPPLLRARLRSPDLAASLALALLVACPIPLADGLASFCLSAVPLKATAARPFWFALGSSIIPALSAVGVARAGSGAPVWWPLSLALAAVLMTPPAWPVTHQLAVTLTLTLGVAMASPRQKRRRSVSR